MGDFTVPRNGTVKLTKVDGQLHLLERARVQAEGESPIEISGEVICEGDAEVEGSLACSRLNVDHGRVEISGDLKSTGQIDVEHGERRIARRQFSRSRCPTVCWEVCDSSRF